MKYSKLFLLAGIAMLAFSCEDVIEVDLADGDRQLVVDAWINNKPETQTIRLTRAGAYFANSFSAAETEASVTVTDADGRVYTFLDTDKDGAYTWTPEAGQVFGEVGMAYTLNIVTAAGLQYTATSVLERVMPIDSIAYEYREEELGQPAGYYAELFARDLPGFGDAYWIKTFKNGQFLNKPQEMNLAYDAGFTAGAGLDGIYLTKPIRLAINRIPDSGDGAVDTNDLPPYALGDSIYVEVLSLNDEAFMFLEQARTQMTLGDASLFAEPPANVPTNIQSINAATNADRAVGFFNVSAASAMGVRVQ